MSVETNSNFMSQMSDQLEVIQSYYARLSKREQYIVVGLVSSVSLIFLILIYFLCASAVGSVDRKIKETKKHVVQMEKMSVELSKIKKQVSDIESVMRRTQSNFQLATELERIAKRFDISIETLKDRPGQPNELYKEKQSTVTVSSLDLRTLINFLHGVENAKQLMRISSLQIKPNFKDRSQLDTNFVVSTFQIKQDEE